MPPKKIRVNLPENSRKRVLEGSTLNYNVGEQYKYVKAVMSLVRQMTTEVRKKVISLFESSDAKEFYTEQKEAAAMDDSIASQARILMDELTKKFDDLFAYRSKELAEAMIQNMDKLSQRSLKSSLEVLSNGVTIKTNFKTGSLNEILKAAVSENVALIKSIGSDYLARVQKQVLRSITTGQGLKDLVPALGKYKGITERHAKNMALDQTRKVYNTMNKERTQAVGVKKFRWVHSGGGQKPRKDHIELNGKIFSYEHLPIIDKKTGERGIPGQAINCRCTMVPIIDFDAVNAS